MKLDSSPNDFVCRSASQSQKAKQENYKLIIKKVNLIIRTKKLTSTGHKALMDLYVSQNIMHHLFRVPMKHLSISANKTSFNFDNIFTRALPDLVVVSLCERCRSRVWLPKQPVHFLKFWLKPHQVKAHWHVQTVKGLYAEFCKRSVYQGLFNVPLKAPVLH